MRVEGNTTSRTPMPIIGGVLSIILASATIITTLVILIIDFTRYLSGDLPIFSVGTYFLAFGGLRILLLTMSALAISGGIFVTRRQQWPIALAGAIASIFCTPGALGWILGIVATVLIAISRKEFKRKQWLFSVEPGHTSP